MTAGKAMKAITLTGLLLCMMQNVVTAQIVTAVDAEEFYKEYYPMAVNQEVILIDGRSEQMFLEGHLANAIVIDANDEQLAEKLKVYADEPLLLVYCTTNKRTGKIIQTLSEFYKGEIIYMSDGITAWKKHGFPLVASND
jgi:rhodanese-related sulfurtransferase